MIEHNIKIFIDKNKQLIGIVREEPAECSDNLCKVVNDNNEIQDALEFNDCFQSVLVPLVDMSKIDLGEFLVKELKLFQL